MSSPLVVHPTTPTISRAEVRLGEALVDALFWVRIEDLGQNYHRAKAELTIQQPDQSLFNPAAEPAQPLRLYQERDGLFGMPVAFGFAKLAHRMKIRDIRVDDRGSVPFQFRGTLRDYQVKPVQDVIEGLRTRSNGGCLEAGCGAGKTTMALRVMAEIQAPTLVIVHNTGLRSQWEGAAKEFLGLRDHEMGNVQQDRCDFRGKKLVFAITQSLEARQYGYPEELYRWPTFVIYDEVHRAAAPTFSWWMAHFAGKFRLGLSATMERADGKSNVFYWHVGRVFAKSSRDEIKPKVYQYLLPPLCPEIRRKDGQPIIARMVSLLAGTGSDGESPKAVAAPNAGSIVRSAIMADELVKALQAGRRVLVLSDRIPLLRDLHARVAKRWGGTVDYYIGGRDELALGIAKQAALLLGTFSMACVDLDQQFHDPMTGDAFSLRVLTEGRDVPLPNLLSGIDEPTLSKPGAVGRFGKKGCVRILTSNGRELVLSKDHVVFTDRGEVSAADLIPGLDYILSPRHLRIRDRDIEDLSADDLWLLGVMLGDGSMSCYQHGQVELTSGDVFIVDEARRILKGHSMDLAYSRRQHWRLCNLARDSGGSRVKAKTWVRGVIERFGLGQRAENKRIPLSWMFLPVEKVLAVLGGLFAADGCLTAKQAAQFSSSSRGMLEQVKTLLLRVGIPSTIRLAGTKGLGCYRLSMGRTETDEFLSIADIRLPRKISRDTPHLYRRRTASFTTMVPQRQLDALHRRLVDDGKFMDIVDAAVAAGVPAARVRFNGKSISVAAYNHLAASAGYTDLLADQRSGWSYDRVKAIEDVGSREVGDFSVPPSKSWVANDLLIHNSEGMDIPELDTLALVTPKSDVRQSVGRIMRSMPGKRQPYVLDFIDPVSVFPKMAGKRLAWYRAQQYDVQQVERRGYRAGS